jgi:hypothetical protein
MMNPSSDKANHAKVKKTKYHDAKEGISGSHANCSPAHRCKDCSFLVKSMLDIAFQRMTGF